MRCPVSTRIMRAGIETERVQAMSGKPAIVALPIGRHDENKPLHLGQTREQGRDEAESRGYGAFAIRHDFVQSPAGETALRQV